MTITAIREGSPFDAIRRTREDGAEAGPDVIDEALYAELRRLADRLDTLATAIAKEAGL